MAGDRSQQREIVGDLSASEGYNAERDSGDESTSGVSKALQTLSDLDYRNDEQEPYPSILAAGANALRLPKLPCPVDGCNYQHDSSQGLAGHVGNAADHGWNVVEITATDLHELASRGTHPNEQICELLDGDSKARQQTDAAEHIERVRQWCRDGVPIDIEKIQVYVHPARKRVEIQQRIHLDEAGFEAYRIAMQESDIMGFDGRSSVNYVNPDRVGELESGEHGQEK